MHYELRVIGNPIAHSKSPFIHHEFAKQAGLSVNYERVLAPLDGFVETVLTLKKSGIFGANVTLPFKEDAYKIANDVSQAAKRAKAANTLCFKPEGIYADNTDGVGLITDITEHIGYPLTAKRILICGAGGAVRGILYPLLSEQPASLTLVNRKQEKADALAKEFSDLMPIHAIGYEDLDQQVFDVIIDGTSFSKDPLPLLFTTVQLSQNSLAYDLKYGQNSSFLAWTKERNATHIHDGIGMLVEQAAAAFQLWTGFKPKTDSVRLALTEIGIRRPA